MKPAVPHGWIAALLVSLSLAACGGGGGDAEPMTATVETSSTSGAVAPSTSPSDPLIAAAPTEADLRPSGPTLPYPGVNATPEEIRAWNRQCPTSRCMIPER